MKVVIGPGESDLDGVVEVSKGALGRHNESPPDHRVDRPNPNVNPVRCRPSFLIHGCQLNNLAVLSARILNLAPVLSWSRVIFLRRGSPDARVYFVRVGER